MAKRKCCRIKLRRNDIRKLFEQQNGLCHYCDQPMVFYRPLNKPLPDNYATKDHVIPRARGGKHKGNLVAACFKCNVAKGHTPYETFRASAPIRTGGGKAASDAVSPDEGTIPQAE